jgi:hypothetical protein
MIQDQLTKKELIKLLEEFDEDSPVWFSHKLNLLTIKDKTLYPGVIFVPVKLVELTADGIVLTDK